MNCYSLIKKKLSREFWHISLSGNVVGVLKYKYISRLINTYNNQVRREVVDIVQLQ